MGRRTRLSYSTGVETITERTKWQRVSVENLRGKQLVASLIFHRICRDERVRPASSGANASGTRGFVSNLSAIEFIESREIESSSRVELGQFSRYFPRVLPSRASPRGRRPACRQRPIVDIRKGRQDWRGREPTANRDQEKENSRSPLFLGSLLCPRRTPVARPLPSRHVLATYT